MENKERKENMVSDEMLEGVAGGQLDMERVKLFEIGDDVRVPAEATGSKSSMFTLRGKVIDLYTEGDAWVYVVSFAGCPNGKPFYSYQLSRY